MFGLNRKQDIEVDREAENVRAQYNQTEFKRRRWPYYLLMLFAFVFFLPNLIGWFGLHQVAIKYAAADFRGDIQVEKFSAGWLQPIDCLLYTSPSPRDS